MDKRFNRSLRRVRLRGPRGVAALVTTLALIVGMVYLIGFSPVFVLREVVVKGAPDDVAETAISNADAPVGRPLARVDTSALAERVSADPRIEQVDVSRGWPSRVEVELTMRTPAAVLVRRGKPLLLMDSEGVAFEEVAKAPSDLPKLTAPPGDVSASSLRGALSARDAIADPWAEEISSLSVTADGDIRFRLGVIKVTWGPPSSTAAKAAALQALLAQEPIDPTAEEPLTIDLTAPATPVVTGLPTVP